jgi:hypothetical protein
MRFDRRCRDDVDDGVMSLTTRFRRRCLNLYDGDAAAFGCLTPADRRKNAVDDVEL